MERTFDIHIDGYRLEVYIWPLEEAMYDHLGTQDRDYKAYYQSVPIRVDVTAEGKPDAVQPLEGDVAGKIHLVEGQFGSGVVAHELTHFALDWVWFRGVDPIEDGEPFCLLIGDLTTRFWRAFYRIAEG